MSTIKDVAQYTGLSIATISKYINGGNVLEENRALIADAIEALDYTVNRAARRLKTNQSYTIGILIPTISSPFFACIVSAMDEVLLKNGYNSYLCSYNFDKEQELAKLRFLLDSGVDGIVLVPEALEAQDMAQFKEILDLSVPVVLLDRTISDFSCDKVLADNMNAAYDAVEYLIIKRHRRIGVITGSFDISTSYERVIGYRRAHEAYSLPVDEKLVKVGAYDTASGYRYFHELLALEDPPTAVFATNYDIMLGAITAAHELWNQLSEGPELVGYDNMEVSRILSPAINMVVQPMEQMGRETANILIERLGKNYDSFPTVMRLKAQLLIP